MFSEIFFEIFGNSGRFVFRGFSRPRDIVLECALLLCLINKGFSLSLGNSEVLAYFRGEFFIIKVIIALGTAKPYRKRII